MNNLDRYRPANTSVAAVAAALTAAQQDTAGIGARVAEAKAIRDTALLDAGAKELRLAEDALALARGDAERLSAITEQLTERLARAREDSAVEAVRTAERNLTAANQEMTEFADASGAELLELLEQAWAIHQRRQAAASAIELSRLHVFRDFEARGDEVAVSRFVEPLAPSAQTLAELFDEIGASLSGSIVDPVRATRASVDADLGG